MKKIFLIVFILSFISGLSFPQNYDVLKREAQKHMQAGRYGEAIDLLNKYISAYPHKADGLHLRGLCYEARGQYEWAALDLRRAIKLEPSNNKIQQDLSRIENNWRSALYKKIEGHKREIAINPNKAVNYLEIGKCKKDLGLWKEAEERYDEYLKREDASPDEVIRYSEILAHNNSIVKGEKILRRYTERFPKDQRLWSRYGFFTLWLGKNRIAIKAFENALAIKPYFKEAQDGLDQAKGKPYMFEWVDTTERYKKPFVAKEYPIDKHYRVLRKNPDDYDTRILLVEELYKNDRIEEAYQQLQILQKDHADLPKVQQYWDSVTTYRDKIYRQKIEFYSEKFAKNPKDKEALLKMTEYFSHLAEYDTAMTVMENYLKDFPNNKELDVRYKYAQYAAWNYKWEKAIAQLNILLSEKPKNPDYQLLRAQVAVWTVQDLDMAKGYLLNVLNKQPENTNAAVSLCILYCWEKDFDSSKVWLNVAKGLDPKNKSVEAAQVFYDGAYAANEEMKLVELRGEAGKIAQSGDCEGSIIKYEEYIAKVGTPDRSAWLEYADVNMCAKRFNKAIEVYDQLLSQEYEYNIAVLRARAYLWSGDSTRALTELKKLAEEDTSNYDAKFYLAEAYERNHEYSDARDLYSELLEKTSDSTKVEILNKRIGWLPVTGLGGIFAAFPASIALSPLFSYYSDNFDLIYRIAGGRLDIGLTGFLSIGASFNRGMLQRNQAHRNYTSFKGNLSIWFNKYLSFNAGFGNLTYQTLKNRSVSDATLKYEKEKKFMLTGYYENTDAGLLLYSPYLVDYDLYSGMRIEANFYKILGYYYPRPSIKLSGYFHYLDLSDGNASNDLQLRIGKLFDYDIWAGYEYFYSNFARVSKLYYSPKDFESHSLWLDWIAQKESSLDVVIGGKLGYVPSSDFVIREVSAGITYKPIENLSITGKLQLGSTYRYDSSYRYISGSVYAYWNF